MANTSLLSILFFFLHLQTLFSTSNCKERGLTSFTAYRKRRQRNQGGVRSSVTSSSVNAFNGNFFLGTQAIYAPAWNGYRIEPYAGHNYSESGFDMLTEFRESVAALGMNHFKFKLAPNNCESYKMSCGSSPSISSLTELSQEPEIAATLADPRFQWYHIWGYSFSLPGKLSEPFTDEQLDAEYNEVYDWAAHILQTYRYTDKVFFLGNWEGDWELMGASGCSKDSAYDFSCVPSQEIIDKYIKWTTTRQKAIDAAKQKFGTQGVNVFFYIEFNLADENFADHPKMPGVPRPTMLNSVVSAVNPDFLSFSSYKSTNKYMDHQDQLFDQAKVDESFWTTLDYAESKLAVKGNDLSMVLGDMTKRVFVGEFSPVNTRNPALFVPSTAQVLRAALEWGCPFVLHWAVYENDSNAVALFPPGSENVYSLSPLRQLFRDWNDAAAAYVEENNPSPNDMRMWAVEWFRAKY